MKAQNEQIGHYIAHTNSTGSDIAGGYPIQHGSLAAITSEPIADAATKSVQVHGVIKAKNAAVAGVAGDNVWWDADADPVDGDAGTGAMTTVASAGDFWMGTLERVLVATDTDCYIDLNRENPAKPAWPNRVHETVSADKTLDTEDTGKVIHVDTDGKVITLPATPVAIDVIIVNDGDDGDVGLSVSPDANDLIAGPDIGGTDDKDLINTKATAKRGDYVHLVGGDTTGFRVRELRGTWATEGA